MTGEEGYVAVGREHYTFERRPGPLSKLLFFLLGGAVGAGIALLLTPQPGSKTRQQIREASQEAMEKAGTYCGQAREKMSTVVDKGKDLVAEQKPLLTTAIQAGREAYEKEKQKKLGESESS